MQINFTGHHTDITDPLCQYTLKKFERLTHRGEQIMQVNIIYTVEKLTYIAEASVHMPGRTFEGKASTKKDMYASVDELVDKLDAQITKFHDKQVDHRHHEE